MVLEENGPVRAVVCAKGTHKAADGKALLDFTARMHFYKGMSKVRVFYTLGNANIARPGFPLIKHLELATNLATKANSYSALTGKGPVTGSLSAGERLAYLQGAVRDPRKNEVVGYWVKQDDKVVSSGGDTRETRGSEWTRYNCLDLTDDPNGAGLGLGIRWAVEQPPVSLSAQDGVMYAGLYPRETGGGHRIGFQVHETFELMYFFHGAGADPAAEMKKFHHHLVGKASLEWYNRSFGGVFPLPRMVSYAEEAKFFEDRDWVYAEETIGRPQGVSTPRRGTGGGKFGYGQHSCPVRSRLISFLRDRSNVQRAGARSCA